MCGIVGFLGNAGGGEAALASIAESMSAYLTHRGPDDSGVWVDGRSSLGLGFRRRLWGRVGWLPGPVRSVAAAGITTISPAHWNRFLAGFMALAPGHFRYANPGEKLHKLALILAARDPDEIYRGLTSSGRIPPRSFSPAPRR